MGKNLQPHARLRTDSMESISYINENLQGGDMIIANILDGDTYICEWTSNGDAAFIFESKIDHLCHDDGKFYEKTAKFAKELGERSVVISFPGAYTPRTIYYKNE